MNIQTISIPHGLCLAPLAGVSDRAFRTVCRAHGAEYLCSEMVSATAICYGDKKTPTLCEFGKDELPMAIQLFGANPDYMAEAARRIACGSLSDRVGIPSAIDINMGCPVRKIVSNGEGSALMQSPALAEEIVRAVVRAVDGKLPVTVKLRAGFDDAHKNAPELAKRLEAAGAAALCIHGRTRTQMYSGKADLGIIAAVKAAVGIPVFGNGDIFSAQDGLRMISETNVDGLMIARGAMGNPWIFAELRAALDGKPYTPPGAKTVIGEAVHHLDLLCTFKPEAVAVREARGAMAHYIRSFRGAAAARAKINEALTKEELKEILWGLLER